MNKQKGFTIIEIIVVIVIIMALEAIVFFNLARYDNKGKNSAIRGNLSMLITRGSTYFEKNGSYDGFCTSDSGGEFTCNCDTVPCNENSTKWCACSPLIVTSDTEPETVFCVDSSGIKKEVGNTDCLTECPAEVGSCQ